MLCKFIKILIFMKKKLLKLFIWFLISIIALTGIFIFLYSYTPIVDRAIENLINVAAGKNVKISYSRLEGNLLGSVQLLNFRMEMADFELASPKIIIHYSSSQILDGKIYINSLIIDSLVARVIQTAGELEQKNDAVSLLSNPLKIDLSGLPDLTVENFIIKNGALVILRDGVENNHFANLNLEIATSVTDKDVNLDVKYIKGIWQEKDISLDQLSFKLSGNKNRLTLNQLTLIVDENELYAHGEIQLLPQLKFFVFADTSYLKIPLINKIIPDFPYQKGFVRFYLDYLGIPSDFTGQIYMAAQLDSLKIARLISKYNYFKGTLILQDINARTNFGSVKGSIQIAPEGKNKIYFQIQDLNLARLAITNLPTELNGRFNLNFNTWKISSLSGEGSALLYDLSYGRMNIDTLALGMDVNKGFWNLKPGSRMVVEKSSQFFVQGQMNSDQQLNLKLTTDKNVLDTLSRRLDFGPIGGVGTLYVTATGPVRNPDISGSVLLDSLIFGGIRSYGVEGKFEVQGISRQRKGFFDLQLSSGLVSNILVTDGILDLKIDRDVLKMDSLSFYNENNYITMKGKLNYQTSLMDISVYDLVFQYQDYRIFSSDTLMAVLENDSLIIENFILNATGNGEIEIRGLYDFSGNSGLGIYFKNIQLLPFNQFLKWKYVLKGQMEISMIVSGSSDSLEVQAQADLQDFMLDDDFIGNMQADVSYSESTFKIDQFQYQHSSQSYLSLTGQFLLPSRNELKQPFKKANQLDFHLKFENITLNDYPFFKEQNYPFTGNMSGNLDVNGTTADFQSTYAFLIRDLQYQEYQFPRIKLQGQINPQEIVLQDGLIDFQGSEIHVNGIKPIKWDYENLSSIFDDRSITLNAKIDEDSLKFLNVITPEVDLLTGDIVASLQFGGTFDNPIITNGKIDVSGGSLYLSKIENPFTDVELQAFFQQQKLLIKLCKAKTSGYTENKGFLQSISDVLLSPFRKALSHSGDEGELNLKGSIDFSLLQKPELNLRLTANKIYANYYLENVKLLFSSKNLTITGRDTLLVNGDVTVHKGEVDLDLEESEKNLLLSSGVRETPPYLSYRLKITIPGNFYVRSEAMFNSFEMMLSGDLQITQEPRELLEIFGTLDVPKGSYYQFEEFSIRDGRVEFVNPKELPQLDIFAEKKKYGFLFQLHVQGTLNNPVKEIRIFDLQTREDVTHLYPETKDQIALLLFGMTFSELGSSAGTAALDKGQEVINQAILARIENEARRFIGLDEIRVESEQGLIDFTNLRLNQLSQKSAISLGKYIMPNLYLEYRTQLGSSGVSSVSEAGAPSLDWEVGNQLYLEYQINRNWSVSSLYARQLYDKFKIDINWRYSF
jgi:hypothetical protein